MTHAGCVLAARAVRQREPDGRTGMIEKIAL
jgi:hypothetical protein